MVGWRTGCTLLFLGDLGFGASTLVDNDTTPGRRSSNSELGFCLATACREAAPDARTLFGGILPRKLGGAENENLAH